MATLEQRFRDVVTRIGSEFKSVRTALGLKHGLNSPIFNDLSSSAAEKHVWELRRAADDLVYNYVLTNSFGVYSTKYGTVWSVTFGPTPYLSINVPVYYNSSVLFRKSTGTFASNNFSEAFEIRAQVDANGTANSDAVFLAHLPGVYATYFGLNRLTSEFGFGGFSEGANFYPFWSKKNFDPNAKASLGTPVYFTNIEVKSGAGYISISSGDDTHTGFVSFYSKTNVRLGYVGYGTSEYIPIVAETSPYNFLGLAPKIFGYEILHRGSNVARTGIQSPAPATLQDRLDKGSVDLRDYDGLDYSGNNEVTSIIQKAFNDAANGGYELVNRKSGILTLTQKLVNHTGKPLRFRSTIKPQISAFNAADFNTKQAGGNACWLHFAHTDIGIEFNRGPNDTRLPAGVERVFGNALQGFGTYRDQGDPTSSSWAPLDSGFDVSLRNSGADIDIVTLNTSRLLELFNADKTTFNLKGQPLRECVRALYNYDVIVGNDVEMWPYWSFHPNVKYFTSVSRIAVRTARADGLYIKRLFDFQGFISHKIENAPEFTSGNTTYVGGTSFGVHFNYLYADSTSTAIQVDTAANNSYVSYDRVLYGPADSGGLEPDTRFSGRQTNGVLVQAAYSDVKIGELTTMFAGACHVQITSTGEGSRVCIEDVLYGSWNRADLASSETNFPAFSVSSNLVNARIEIGTKQQMPTQVGSGGHVVDMRRPMPLMTTGVSDSARRGPDGNAFSPSFKAKSSMQSAWHFDGSDSPIGLGVGVATPLAVGSGLLVISESQYSGALGLIALGGGLVSIVSSGNGMFVNNSSPASGQIGIYFANGVYNIKSNLAGATTLYLSGVRNRPAV